jgi:hypothetical protein
MVAAGRDKHFLSANNRPLTYGKGSRRGSVLLGRHGGVATHVCNLQIPVWKVVKEATWLHTRLDRNRAWHTCVYHEQDTFTPLSEYLAS